MGNGRICIKCKQELRSTQVEEVELDVCSGCGGLWLDRGEIQQLARKPAEAITGLRAQIYEGPDPRLEQAADALDTPCPACGGKLTLVNLGAIQAERCAECEGLFLDRGELDRAMAEVECGEAQTLLAIARSVSTSGSIGG